MPGAQPRRSPVARLASSARRGTNVPAGVPGVYRVPRVRTVTVQANDTGAAAGISPWIQDEPLTVSRRITTIQSSEVHGATFVPAGSVAAQAAALIATSQTGTIGTVGGALWTTNASGSDSRAQAFQSTHRFDEVTELTGTYYSPTLPPGATGYEDHPDDTAAHFIGSSIVGDVHVEGFLGSVALNPGQTVDCYLVRLEAGTTLSEWHTPGDLATSTTLVTLLAGDDAEPVSLDLPLDPDGQIILMPVGSYFLDGTGWGVPDAGGINLNYFDEDDVEDAGLWCTFSYQRNRYRFTY